MLVRAEPPRRHVGLLCGLGAAAAFGSFSVCVALEYEHGANAPFAVVMRFVGSLPMVVLLLRPGVGAQLTRAAWLLCALILLHTLTSATLFAALERLTPAVAISIMYLYPVLTLLGAALLGLARLTPWRTTSAVVAVTGVALVAGGSGSIDPLGLGLSLVNAAAFAGALLVAQRTVARLDPATTTAVVFLLAGALQAVFAVAALEPHPPEDLAGYAYGIASGLVGTAVAYGLFYRAIGNLGAPAASVICCLEVAVAVVATSLLLHSPVGPRVIVGAALILVAAAAATLTSPRSDAAFADPRAAP